jgi:Eukaryotic translation initiation factor 3 subunit 7 (eIF-3)
LVKVRVINENEFSTALRRRLEQSKGACLGEEIRNNSAKVARWYCQLRLAEAQVLKIAYTSRIAQKDANKHEALYVDFFIISNK